MRSFALMPSMSKLFLVSKFDIVLKTVAGEVIPRISVGGLGLGGIKSSGRRSVGRTALEIWTLTFEKNH